MKKYMYTMTHYESEKVHSNVTVPLRLRAAER